MINIAAEEEAKEEESNRDNLRMETRIFYLARGEKRQRVEELKIALREREEIAFAYLYGSFEEDLPFHDVDVGVYAEGIRPGEATSYSLRLAEELSARLRLPVDVRVLNYAPVTFRYHVFRGELIGEKNEPLRAQIMERTVQRYLDLKPILYRAMKEAFAV